MEVFTSFLCVCVCSQHIVYFTKFILAYIIPDVPYAVKEQIKREKYLTQVILHETNLKLVSKRLKATETETESWAFTKEGLGGGWKRMGHESRTF